MGQKNKKVAFFDAKPYDRKSFDLANKEFGFDITYYDAHLNSRTVELAYNYDAVCVFVNDTINSQVLNGLHKHDVGVIALRSAGYNNVDFKAAFGKVHVVRVPAYSPCAVAEHAAALMLALNRKTHRAYYRIRDGNFSINGLLGFDMHGKTAGIIGTGKIGRCLISILQGFGMKVLVYDVYRDEKYEKEAGIRYVALDKLFREADIISLHCPLTPETEHMINEDNIKKMKDGVMIINTGRGKLINTRALIKMLKSGKLGSAGLDVYEEEGEYFFEDFSTEMISDDVLARLMIFPNVLITSHQGFFTKEAIHNIAVTTLENIKGFFNGGYLKNEICYQCDLKECRKDKKQRCF
ncbi:MAG: 2-hydroxyacid dehydrogenase [Actinomycetota bacterium]|nr:2-hydroxyacid dehydrogenase [Actinomycetota bacterium]